VAVIGDRWPTATRSGWRVAKTEGRQKFKIQNSKFKIARWADSA